MLFSDGTGQSRSVQEDASLPIRLNDQRVIAVERKYAPRERRRLYSIVEAHLQSLIPNVECSVQLLIGDLNNKPAIVSECHRLIGCLPHTNHARYQSQNDCKSQH